MQDRYSGRDINFVGKAAISILLHASQGKHKYRAVFCHWLDGYIPDVSGQTYISVKKWKNSAKRGTQTGEKHGTVAAKGVRGRTLSRSRLRPPRRARACARQPACTSTTLAQTGSSPPAIAYDRWRGLGLAVSMHGHPRAGLSSLLHPFSSPPVFGRASVFAGALVPEHTTCIWGDPGVAQIVWSGRDPGQWAAGAGQR